MPQNTGNVARLMAKQVRLTLAKANLRRAEAGKKAITISRPARDPGDPKAASAPSLDLASKIATVLDCGIEDVLEVAT